MRAISHSPLLALPPEECYTWGQLRVTGGWAGAGDWGDDTGKTKDPPWDDELAPKNFHGVGDYYLMEWAKKKRDAWIH